MDVGGLFRLVKRREGAALPYALRATKYEFFTDANGYPCQRPPWGSLYAVDLDSGDIRWRATLGEFDELKARGIPKTGAPNIGGSIVTDGGLVFVAATNDRKFRAFDRDTGEELWTARAARERLRHPRDLPGQESGRQFVVIAAGGGNKYDKVFTRQDRGLRPARGGRREVRPRSRPGLFALAAALGARRSGPRPAARSPCPKPVAPQPVAFSHRLHAEKAGLACLACHDGATKQDAATLPQAPTCLLCHTSIIPDSPEVAKLRAAPDGRIAWARVYPLPHYVFFGHREHLAKGATCAECHGPVETRDALRKEVSTGMNACLACHRRTQAPVHCAACHTLGH